MLTIHNFLDMRCSKNVEVFKKCVEVALQDMV